MSEPITILWMETETVERTVNKVYTATVTPERFAELVASHAPAYVGSSPGEIIDSLYYSQPNDLALLDALAADTGAVVTVTVDRDTRDRDINGPSGHGKVEHDAEYDEDEDEETDDDEDEEDDEDDEDEDYDESDDDDED